MTREEEIDAIAEVLHKSYYGENPSWARAKELAKLGNGRFIEQVGQYRRMAEHILASSWLDEKLEERYRDGIDDGVFYGG